MQVSSTDNMNKKARFFIIAGLIVLGMVLIFDVIMFRGNGHEGIDGLLRDVLIETHGMLFDILLFGILLAIYEGILEKRREQAKAEEERKNLIKRYEEEIDDFRGWHEQEAMYRNVGNIRRLNQLGITEINLENTYLVRANLRGANLNKAKLRRANLEGANLQGASLEHANLNGAVLYKTNLQGASLKGANLKGTTFVGSDSTIKSVSFLKSNLDKADFRGVSIEKTQIQNISLAGAIFWEWQREILRKSGADLKQAVFKPDPQRPAPRLNVTTHQPSEE